MAPVDRPSRVLTRLVWHLDADGQDKDAERLIAAKPKKSLRDVALVFVEDMSGAMIADSVWQMGY